MSDASIDSPRIKARCPSLSGDWVQDNGDWNLDVRLLMEADGGSPVYIDYNGCSA